MSRSSRPPRPLPGLSSAVGALGLVLAGLAPQPAQAQAQNAPGTPAVPTARAADGTEARGRWLTESGNLEIDIAPCEGGVWCGTVVKVLANRSMRAPGEAMTPADPRPALGMVILSDLSVHEDGHLKGRLYNRESAKHYSVRLSMDGPGQLLVRPYVGLPVFGKTQLWRRVTTANGSAAASGGGARP